MESRGCLDSASARAPHNSSFRNSPPPAVALTVGKNSTALRQRLEAALLETMKVRPLCHLLACFLARVASAACLPAFLPACLFWYEERPLVCTAGTCSTCGIRPPPLPDSSPGPAQPPSTTV